MKVWLFVILLVGAAVYQFGFRRTHAAGKAPASEPVAAQSLGEASPAPPQDGSGEHAAGEATSLQATAVELASAEVKKDGAGPRAAAPDPSLVKAGLEQADEIERLLASQPDAGKVRLQAALGDKQCPPPVRVRLASLIERAAASDVERRALLSRVLDAGSFPGEAEAYQRLTQINQALIFSRKSPYAARLTYKVKAGDNLWNIKKALQKANPGLRLTTEFIQRTNELASPSIKAGLVLSVPSEPLSIRVSKARFLLTLYLGDVILRRFPVCLGEDGKTPSGEFQINSRLDKPAWIKPGKGTIPFGDPGNVLGTRWLGFDKSDQAEGLGIHGTWEPNTIGQNLSNGCVRLRNEDVEDLFDLVPEGTPVTIE